MTIAEVLELLHEGGLVEIRAIGVPVGTAKRAVWSGYFTDYQAAEAAVAECEKARAGGIYLNLNSIHPGCIARSPNLLDKHPLHTTTNGEITARRWMLIDVDPRRPSGISSTLQELSWAKGVRDEIADWLEGEFPEQTVIRCCSGNGYHALLRSDLEVAEQESLLGTLECWFGREEVVIDRSVTKLAQLTKCYGTWARKGYSYGEREHRRSFVEAVR